jgi:hypothetical protein
MENTALTPQEKKEQFITNLEAQVLKKLGNNLSCKWSTCSDAPSYGWSVEEYAYMPVVAARLREKGYSVTCQVNHGVIDWTIVV